MSTNQPINQSTNHKSARLRSMVQLAILIAIIAILSFTPLGFLRVGVVAISLLAIPVAIGAMTMGPKAGALLGGVFGLFSLLQCFGLDAFGTTLMSISPLYTVLVCLVPRILCGLFAGLVYQAIAKADRHQVVGFFVGGLTAAVTNTVFFVGGLLLLFGSSDYILSLQGDLPLFDFAVAFVGINGLIEAVACTVVAGAVAKGVQVALKRRS